MNDGNLVGKSKNQDPDGSTSLDALHAALNNMEKVVSCGLVRKQVPGVQWAFKNKQMRLCNGSPSSLKYIRPTRPELMNCPTCASGSRRFRCASPGHGKLMQTDHGDLDWFRYLRIQKLP